MSCGCTSSVTSSGCNTHSATGCSKADVCGNSYKLSVFDWLSGIESPSRRTALVEVRFKNDRKCIFSNPEKLPLRVGSVVAVEASPGHDIGVVSLTGELAHIQKEKKKIRDEDILKVYRLATEKDIEDWHTSRGREKKTQEEARKIVKAHKLQMKISDVEFQGDGSRVTFFYTAESRVDFRQLIKEFAVQFRAKIDMKQIGFRQEAAKLGGIGSCGRELCCSSWLTDFRSVNTNAARYQQLSINPQKLAGQCGKLKCCLNFELDSYLDYLDDFPPSNTQLDTEKGRAYCIKIDVFKRIMWFAYAENPLAWHDISIYEVTRAIEINKTQKKCPSLEELKGEKPQLKSADLIQESSVDRFEKKTSGRKNRSRKNKPAQHTKSTRTNETERRTKDEPSHTRKAPNPKAKKYRNASRKPKN